MADLSRLLVGDVQCGIAISTSVFSNLLIDSSGDKLAVAFQADVADTITHLGFRYGVRTGTPAVHKISLQGVGTTGLPDGTVKGGGSPASKTFTPPADTSWNSTWQWVQLDNSYTTTRGEMLAWVIEYSSGTVDGSNNSTFTYLATNTAESRISVPYPLIDSTGSWAKQNAGYPVWGYKSASNAYGLPILTVPSTVTTLGTNGHRAALKFTLPAGSGDTFKVAGAIFSVSTPASADWKFGLWDAAGSVIQDVTLDADYTSAIGSAFRSHRVIFDESSLTALNFGTAYYLGVERTTVSCALAQVDVSAANDLKALAGGDGFHLATWNGSAWSDVATARPFVKPIFDDWTEPAGGGSGGRRPQLRTAGN